MNVNKTLTHFSPMFHSYTALKTSENLGRFHSRALNNKINSIHERALIITYNDSKSTFEELLNKDNSVSIHHRNLRI